MSFELYFFISFVAAGLVSFCAASVCEKPLSILMRRIIQNETSHTFTRYVRYATYLVGISHGVTVDPLGFEFTAQFVDRDIERQHLLLWIQVVIMQSLTAIASMYLALFILGLIAYITVKAREK